MLHSLSEKEQQLEAQYESKAFEWNNTDGPGCRQSSQLGDSTEANLTRRSQKSDTLDIIALWSLTLIAGIIIGALSSGVHSAVSHMNEIRIHVINDAIEDSRIGGVFVAVGLTTAFTAIASLGWFFDASLSGSGLPEVISFLNGVDTTAIFTLNSTLLTIVGTIAICSSGMAVGYEGLNHLKNNCINGLFTRYLCNSKLIESDSNKFMTLLKTRTINTNRSFHRFQSIEYVPAP